MIDGQAKDRRQKRRTRRRSGCLPAAAFLLLLALTFFFLVRPALSGLEDYLEKQESSIADSERKIEAFPPPRIEAELEAKAACLWNSESDSFLYEKNAQEPAAPASTSKLLTALVTLDYCDPEEIVRVGGEIKRIGKSSSTIWLKKGDRLSVEHLLDGLLLSSGNDAAYALAVYTGRKIAGQQQLSIDQALDLFLEKMNDKAGSLGAVNSLFTSPDGYDGDGFSTAADLARIGLAFFQNDLLQNIVETKELSVEWACGKSISHQNFVEMLYPESPYYFPTLLGGKTGFTKRAGNCAVTAAAINDQVYICVVLGEENRESRWQDSLTLYQAAAAL